MCIKPAVHLLGVGAGREPNTEPTSSELQALDQAGTAPEIDYLYKVHMYGDPHIGLRSKLLVRARDVGSAPRPEAMFNSHGTKKRL